MLLKIPSSNYNSAVLIKKTEKNQKILLAHPFKFTDQNMHLEIIPYERIWNELLILFDDKTASSDTSSSSPDPQLSD